MVPLRRALQRTFGGDLWTATLLGLASIPFTLVENWDVVTGSGSGYFSGGFLALACVVAGYVYVDRSVVPTTAGSRTALVGSVPAFCWLALVTVRGGLGPRGPALAAVAVLFALTVGLLTLLAGMLFGFVGEVLAMGVRRVRPVGEGN